MLTCKNQHKKNFIASYYRELDAQFDLVMILERFDESLVLLQDLMCWPTEDIVYLKQNERTAKESTFDRFDKTREESL